MTLSRRRTPAILIATAGAVDILAVTLGYALARAVTHATLFDGSLAAVPSMIFVTVLIWPVVFACFGLYDLRRPGYLERLVAATVTAVAVVVLVTAVARLDVPRDFILMLFVVCLVFVLPGRVRMRWVAGAPIAW
jgi:FlaA1/EpsC-like NDP-sugar epimerase